MLKFNSVESVMEFLKLNQDYKGELQILGQKPEKIVTHTFNDERHFSNYIRQVGEYLTGCLRLRYDNGNLHYEVNLKDGQLHGTRKSWYENGKPEFDEHYVR